MLVVRIRPGGAAVTIPPDLVEQYQARGWVVDEKPRPRRKPAESEPESA